MQRTTNDPEEYYISLGGIRLQKGGMDRKIWETS